MIEKLLLVYDKNIHKLKLSTLSKKNFNEYFYDLL
jgi:hypothetical protein